MAPETVEDAVKLYEKHGNSAVIMAGATDVVVRLRDKLISPDFVIDIKRIKGLTGIEFSEKNGLRFGACVTLNELAGNEYVKRCYPFLAEAAESVGSKQLRNRATCVGNIVNASPLADTATPLYVCGAIIETEGPSGKREIPIADFIKFVRRVDLIPGEIVTGIRVPYVFGIEGKFFKISRRHEVDLSTVCGTVAKVGRDYRIALGAVAPTPLRLKKTEALLSGKELTPQLISQAAELAVSEISPIDDVRASRRYREHISALIVRRGLEHFAS
jgi:carbon-monoxide dehydrogenase medium subunit